MRDDSTTSNNILWFIAGLGIGAAIGLIAAPKSGAETRRLLAQKASEASGYVTDNGREYFDRSHDLYERGRHLAEEAAELFEEGRRLMERADAAGTRA